MSFFERGFRAGRPGVLGLLTALGALGMSLPNADPPALVAVELRGDLPREGWVSLESPTVHQALVAAGADPTPFADGPVSPGTRIRLVKGELSLEPSPYALVLGQPLSLNDASAQQLEALPGLGPSLSAVIVADREVRGPFLRYEDLDRVKGIGPAKLAELRPYLRVGP